jgi:hypothetical protein
MSEIVPPQPSFAEQALRDCLLRFRRIQFRVTGGCMEPDLVPGQVVTVSTRSPRLGDVVLVSQADGLRLHRLVFGPPLASPGTAWRTKGDRSSCLDPPLLAGAVLGTVVEPRRRRLGLAVCVCARALWARLRDGRRPGA